MSLLFTLRDPKCNDQQQQALNQLDAHLMHSNAHCIPWSLGATDEGFDSAGQTPSSGLKEEVNQKTGCICLSINSALIFPSNGLWFHLRKKMVQEVSMR